ncbi:transcriptional regulator [Paenibacillus sp. CAA11]|uniref:PucR family transcriptional regulator n=1 Tax=Paenibacillus sp. CAA11 TaxID=1532905 RepID=UPI000D3AC91A|nr:helix-turn-helix domain-containing protein [Paenibacillus sp. CAA11]AWB42898.1 transcriptional regulator [Paenibacillus sp. CAA11]
MEILILKQQLENVLGQPLQERAMDLQQWTRVTGDAGNSSAERAGKLLFPWKYENSSVLLWEMDASSLTESERKLVELLLQTAAKSGEASPAFVKSDEETVMRQFGHWLHQQLKSGNLSTDIPEEMTLKSKLSSSAVPFLLSCESSLSAEMGYTKLNKLLRSYFGVDVILIPLQDQEWIILARENQLEGLIEESEEGTEAERAMLLDLCQGIYELISNEWVGNFHLSVAQPIVPLRTLTETALLLRETVLMGRMFHVSEHIHLPWDLYLERLIYSIPDSQRKLFIEQMGVGTGIFNDAETLTTLETFFQLDCNVSETAKRLYIHRNTLLYRMDKIKQETGLDVRSFRDAVLVKLTLLLYKVTKRK